MATSHTASSPNLMASVQQETNLASKLETIIVVDVQAQVTNPIAVAQVPCRSHDPENNMKRSDPFQFGSRYLQENDDIFEFNAWDHVETDDAYKEYAEIQYAKQREAPVSDFDKSKSVSFIC